MHVLNVAVAPYTNTKSFHVNWKCMHQLRPPFRFIWQSQLIFGKLQLNPDANYVCFLGRFRKRGQLTTEHNCGFLPFWPWCQTSFHFKSFSVLFSRVLVFVTLFLIWNFRHCCKNRSRSTWTQWERHFNDMTQEYSEKSSIIWLCLIILWENFYITYNERR